MFKVGLTGGIGCGKSTIAKLFAQHAVAIIDADEIAHALVSPKSVALDQISNTFGEDCLLASGALDRAKLRDIIFNNSQKKLQLEHIMHPLIFAEIERQISALSGPYCIIAIPLLLETHKQSSVDHILVVDCSETEQIKRVQLRDGLSTNQIKTVIQSQVSREQRLAEADSIIYNTQDNKQLVHEVNNLHQQFIKEAV